MRYDESIRNRCRELNLPHIYALVSYYEWCWYYNNGEYEAFIPEEYDTQHRRQITDYWEDNYPDLWDCARLMYEAKKRRKRRIKAYLEPFIQIGDPYFITLDFTSESLKNSSEKERRKAVKDWCKENCDVGIANIDYGKEKGREHYHILTYMIGNDPPDLSTWKMGEHPDIEKVYDHNGSINYIMKLIGHSIKETTNNKSIIYF